MTLQIQHNEKNCPPHNFIPGNFFAHTRCSKCGAKIIDNEIINIGEEPCDCYGCVYGRRIKRKENYEIGKR